MILILDEQTANGIAAGEVVERPASVVKEMLENSLDAGASRVSVEIKQGGIGCIRVADNGIGMSPEDAKMSFLRHATSKIRNLQDLDTLDSMGFRGEALASIAAVSKVNLITRTKDSEAAYQINLEAGNAVNEGVTSASEGTIFEVQELFYNTPARYKFLKRDSTEAAYVQDLIERQSFSRPDVSFSFKKDGKQIFLTPGDNKLLSVIYTLWGKESAESMIPLKESFEGVTVQGFITNSSHYRKNRSRLVFIVNNRVIQSGLLKVAVDRSIAGHFVKGQFPELILKLDVPHTEIDVNVHPQKTEVRFSDEQKIFRAAYHTIKSTLEKASGVKNLSIAHENYVPDKNNNDTTRAGMGKSNKSTLKQIEIQSVEPLGDYKIDSETPGLKVKETFPTVKTSEFPFDDNNSGHLQSALKERLNPQLQAKVFSEVDLSTAPKSDTTTTQQVLPQSNKAPLEQTEAISEQSHHVEKNTHHYEQNYERNELISARIIGQVFNTYLLLEHGENLLLVDQHAAHERILYEELLESYIKSGHRVHSQLILSPILIKFTPLEIERALDQQEQINAMGFDFEQFADDSLILRAVPSESKKQDYHPETAFRAVVELASDQRLDLERDVEEIYHTIACKAAVKAHDILSYQEMKHLLAELTKLQDPFHCPHGRPVIIRLNRNDLEKFFSRIV